MSESFSAKIITTLAAASLVCINTASSAVVDIVDCATLIGQGANVSQAEPSTLEKIFGRFPITNPTNCCWELWYVYTSKILLFLSYLGKKIREDWLILIVSTGSIPIMMCKQTFERRGIFSFWPLPVIHSIPLDITNLKRHKNPHDICDLFLKFSMHFVQTKLSCFPSLIWKTSVQEKEWIFVTWKMHGMLLSILPSANNVSKM